MKTVAFGTMKGGTGKTTLTFNIAGELKKGAKVLLWDIDPQCNLSNAAGVDITSRNTYTTRDIFENPSISPDKVIIKTAHGFDVIPSSIDLTVTEAVLPSKAARELILTHYLEDNAEFFQQYDYILFDTNPSMSNVNKNGFVAADSIVLICDVSGDALRGAELFMFLWDEIRSAMRLPDTVKALVLNNCDARINLSAELGEYCMSQDHLARLLIPEPIPSRVLFKKSLLQHVPVTQMKVKEKSDQDAQKSIQQLVMSLYDKEVF